MFKSPLALLLLLCCACSQSVKLRPDAVELATKLKASVTAPVWSVPLEAPYADLLEPIGDDAVLVGALAWNDKYATFRRGPVALLELESGHIRWRLDALPTGQTVLVTTEPLIVLSTVTPEATTVTAVDRDSGQVMWSRRFSRRAGLVQANVLARASLIVADDVSVHAVELSSGIDRWAAAIPASQTPLSFSVWLGEPAVYVITDRLHRLSLDGGRLEWSSAEIVDGPVTEALRVADQLITVGAAAITSFNTIDGRVSFRHAREGLKPLTVSTLTQQVLVAWKKTTSSIASELTLQDEYGAVTWHSEPLPELRGGPIIDDDGFVLVTTAAQVLRIDARSGAIVARGKIPLELISKRGLPDRLTLNERQLHLHRERGVAVFDLASLKSIWSLPVLSGRPLEWTVFEKQHYAWLAGNTAIPQSTVALLATARRASNDALHERARETVDGARLVAETARAGADSLHAYLAAQSQAYLDDTRARALFAGANLRAAQHDYFDTSSSYAIAPVTYGAERNGVLLVDSVKRSAAAVWAGPRVDDDVPLAIVDRKNGRVVTVAPSFETREHRAIDVRGATHHTVSIASYPLTLTELRDPYAAARASAELVGIDPQQIEVPRLIASHEGQKLAERYPEHGCPKDYVTTEFSGGTLAHYATHADDADLLLSLVRNGANLEAPSNAELTILELAQHVAKPETVDLVRSPRPTKNDALRTAAAQGDTADVLRLLGEDADPNSGLIVPGCDFGPVHFAIVKHESRMVEALIKAGAWLNFVTPEGTALDVANAYKAPKSLVQMLRQRGAKRGAEVKKK